MAKADKTVFFCKECGYESAKWLGQCPGCKEVGTFVEEPKGPKNKTIRRNVPTVLSLVGLRDKSKVYPRELSGGEQQRTALARAIVNNPPILIADEPTGNLDPATAWDIMTLLEEINKRGTTVVIATHAKDIVDQMQKRVITLENGRIIRDKKGGYSDEI